MKQVIAVLLFLLSLNSYAAQPTAENDEAWIEDFVQQQAASSKPMQIRAALPERQLVVEESEDMASALIAAGYTSGDEISFAQLEKLNGSSLRFFTQSGRTRIARVESVSADHVTLLITNAGGYASLRIPRDQIKRIEVP